MEKATVPSLIQDLIKEEYEVSEDGYGSDDLEEDYEFDEEGQPHFTDGEFRIRQISKATIVRREVRELYKLLNTPYLKLNPEYQRDVVWDDTRASGLIASLMQGYFIPPIIFNVTKVVVEEDGVEREKYCRTCVDGKQRLTSIKKFMDGTIPIVDSKKQRWYYDHPRDAEGKTKISTHSIMGESAKSKFRESTFVCYEYDCLDNEIEENMFQLVQRGMPLTPAEKMRAMSTKWANFVKKYESDYAVIVSLCKQTRGSGFRTVLQIFSNIIEVENPTGSRRSRDEGTISHKPTLKISPATLTKLLKDDTSLDEGIKSSFKKVFDKFQKLIELSSEHSRQSKSKMRLVKDSAFSPDPDYLREPGVGHVKTFAPIELLGAAILVFVHGQKRTHDMLLGDIKEMRHYLRENHKDLRINGDCWQTVWKYVDSVMVQRRGGAGAVAVAAAVQDRAVRSSNGTAAAAATATTTAAAPQNIIVNLADDSDSEYPPLRPSKRARASNSSTTQTSESEQSHAPNDAAQKREKHGPKDASKQKVEQTDANLLSVLPEAPTKPSTRANSKFKMKLVDNGTKEKKLKVRSKR